MRTLYTFFRSSTSYRVRIALSVKGLDWEPRYVSLPKLEHREPAYLEVNPQGLVPALVEEDGHVLARIAERVDHVAADIAGAAGDQKGHELEPPARIGSF